MPIITLVHDLTNYRHTIIRADWRSPVGITVKGEARCGMKTQTLRSEKGALHILGGLFALVSIYSTYLLFKEQLRSETLSSYVDYQKKQLDGLELRMQLLEFRTGKSVKK